MGRNRDRRWKLIARLWVVVVLALASGALTAVALAAGNPPGPPTGTGGNGGCDTDFCTTIPAPPSGTTGNPSSGPTSTPTGTTSTPQGTSTSPKTGTSSTAPPVTVGGSNPPKGKTLKTPVNVISAPTSTLPATTTTYTPPPPTGTITPVPTVSTPTPTPKVVVSIPKPVKHVVVHEHVRAHHPAPPPKKPPHHPAPAPKPRPPHKSLPNAVHVTSSVVTPQHIRFKATKAALAVALGALLVLLLAFPSELFNKTYDENEEEIHEALSKVGLRKHHLPPVWGFLAFVLVGAGMTIWLALAEGGDGNPVAVAVGLFIALPVVTFAFEIPAELYLRTRSKVPGSLHILPTALAVAVICALVTRLIKLEPAYLYGIFASYTAVRAGRIAEEEEGKSVLVGALATLVVGGLAWFGWGALDAQAHGASRDWLVILSSTAMFWIFVMAAEGLVFGLMPLKYLDGSLLKNWRSGVWFISQLAAAAFFVYVQMLHGSTKQINTFSDLVKPYLLFLGFGVASFAFWRYFQWDGRPTALDEEAEPPKPIPVVAAAIAATPGNGVPVTAGPTTAAGNGVPATPAPIPDEPGPS